MSQVVVLHWTYVYTYIHRLLTLLSGLYLVITGVSGSFEVGGVGNRREAEVNVCTNLDNERVTGEEGRSESPDVLVHATTMEVRIGECCPEGTRPDPLLTGQMLKDRGYGGRGRGED